MARIDKGLAPFPERPVDPAKLAEVVHDYVDVPRREKKRADTYARHLERLMPEPVNLISEFTLRRYRENRRSEGVKGSTINRELLFLAAACRHAKCGFFFDALDKKSRARVYVKEDPGQPERLSDEDVEAIAAKLPAAYRGPVWLALLTGMREREVLELPWSEVRGGEVWLPGSRTKSGYPRTVYLATEAVRLLPRRGKDEELVFRGPGGWRVSEQRRA
jgi:integrase